MPKPTRRDSGRRAELVDGARRARPAAPPATRRSCRARRRALDRARRASTTPARIFVPPTSTPMTRVPLQSRAGTILRRMARPAERSRTASTAAVASRARCRRAGRPEKAAPRARPERDGTSRYRGPGPKTTARRPTQIRWSRELAIALVLIVLFFIVWGVVGYLAFRSGVSAANKRLPQDGRARARTGSGLAALEPDDDPAARHRPLARRVAQRRPALRLDHAPAHRSRPRAALLPLDPARPARRDPGLRGEQDQRRLPGRRAPARRAHGRRVHRHPGQPPRGGRTSPSSRT